MRQPPPSMPMMPGPIQQVQIPRAPTAADVAEVEKVRGMQARTKALELAISAVERQSVEAEGLVTLASLFALFILEGQAVPFAPQGSAER